MKKNYILLASLLMLGGSVYAQKLSPNTSLMLMDAQSGSMLKSADVTDRSVDAFVHLNDASAVDAITALGGTVQSVVSSDLVTATIPLSALTRVAALDGVRYVQAGSEVRLLMDNARKDCFVDDCQAGTADFGAYTGKGVVVGIVDNGFQYDHVDFKTSDGTSRVKRVWDQNSSGGNSPKAYGYGTEYTNYEEMASARYDMASQYHATHVSGIAAGSDKSTPYYGVAPDADLVFVSFKNATSNIVDGIKYVFDYAESVGKPCVVNISLGSHMGPHDGTSSVDRSFAELVGPGRIIVGACGNEGLQDLHASKTLTEDDLTMKTMLGFPSSTSSSKSAYVDIWGSPNTDMTVKVIVADALRGKTVAESPEVSVGGTTDVKYVFPDGSHVVCTVQMAAVQDPDNLRPDVLLMCKATSIDEGYKIGVQVTSAAGSTIHMWNNATSGTFTSPNKRGWTNGDNAYTVGELGGTSPDVVSVGSYNTKSYYTDLSGDTYVINTDLVGKLGDISSFSSIGPTVDGRQKPDAVAPGCAIISATNRYYSGLSTAEAVAKTGSDYYDYNIGTSMASPFVAGTVALWLQANPSLTPADVHKIIAGTARRDSFTGEASDADYVWGAGKIDALSGLKYALSYTGIEETAATTQLISVVTDRRAKTATVSYAGNEAVPAHVAVYSAAGQQVAEYTLTASGQTLDLSALGEGLYLLHVQHGTTEKTVKTLF